MLECVVNVSEGRDPAVVERLADSVADSLLDVHLDPHHNRSVFTLLGEEAPRRLARAAVELVDIRLHDGVHPRLGVVDVVPFVPLEDATMDDAVAARDAYARWSADVLRVPCFLYGPERTLPEVRRTAWATLAPDTGSTPHASAGATCAGARDVLVAYNVWLVHPDIALARRIASEIRSPEVRTLGLAVGSRVQVSMNLVAPDVVGPDVAFDRVAALTGVAGAELVGLVPESVLGRIPRARWAELDLSGETTIEARRRARGL